MTYEGIEYAIRAGLGRNEWILLISFPDNMAWPLIEPIADVSRDHIRRVYLKRMRHLQPDIWVEEDFLNNPNRWPPTDFHRSIYRSHAEHRPWLDADLVLERIEAEAE